MCNSWSHMGREGNVTLSSNGSPFTESDSFKYLGVMIDKHVVNKVSRKLGAFWHLRITSPMAAAERLYKTMILPTFDYCDEAWHGCGKVNSDALKRLQHRAAKLIFPNSSFGSKEWNATWV